MKNNRCIDFGDVRIGVMHFPYRKKPCLYVYIKDENCHYKVASFNSEETTDWFLEIVEEAINENHNK